MFTKFVLWDTRDTEMKIIQNIILRHYVMINSLEITCFVFLVEFCVALIV